MDLAGGP